MKPSLSEIIKTFHQNDELSFCVKSQFNKLSGKNSQSVCVKTSKPSFDKSSG